MSLDKGLQKRIREANVVLHRSEAKYYELIHPEIYNKCEQKRLLSTLKMVDELLTNNQRPIKKALDFGAGTGNLTGKLLKMGYHVTAIDISREMCAILEKKYTTYLNSKELIIVNSPIEDVSFDKGEFDLITCYSVLHHLPDYIGALQRLSGFLRKGGVMYVDHEVSPFYWKREPRAVAELVKLVYLYSSPLVNSMCFRVMGINLPPLDYRLSDYWQGKGHTLDHEKIQCVFEKEAYKSFERVDYHLRRTCFSNPFFHLYTYFCRPETSFWVAQK